MPGADGSAGAAFARAVVAHLELSSWARARSLLWAASRLGAYGASVGIEAEEVLLSEPFIERFMAAGTPRWSAPARRTARSNLLFLATERTRSGPRRAGLSRERALAPYSASELASYLALCDAQPTEARRRARQRADRTRRRRWPHRRRPAPCARRGRHATLWRRDRFGARGASASRSGAHRARRSGSGRGALGRSELHRRAEPRPAGAT